MEKFKNIEELEKAYKELQKEFTKKCQKLKKTEIALKLAVEDKCKFENKFYSMVFKLEDGEIVCPKREQYYLDMAIYELIKYIK